MYEETIPLTMIYNFNTNDINSNVNSNKGSIYKLIRLSVRNGSCWKNAITAEKGKKAIPQGLSAHIC